MALDLFLINGLRQRKTHVLGVWNRLSDGSIEADVLFTGSSRAFLHYDAPEIQKRIQRSCYNIGMDGCQLDLQYPWLKTYLERNAPPQLIIQGVDIISLMPDTNVFFPTQFPPYLDNEDIYRTLVAIDPDWWRHRYVPMYSFALFGYEYTGLAIKGAFSLEDVANDPLKQGYHCRNKYWDGSFDRFKERNPKGLEYRVTEASIRKLEMIIELAAEHDVPIVLVYAPELSENFELTLDRDRILRIYKETAARYDIGFWDLSKMGICNYRRYFYNSQHLNKDGVAVLTEEIAERIRNFLNGPS